MLTKQPSLIGITKENSSDKFIIPFEYNFGAGSPTIEYQTPWGLQPVSQYVFDPSSLPSIVYKMNVRSLQFCLFIGQMNTANFSIPGELLIDIPSTGQRYIINSSLTDLNTVTPANADFCFGNVIGCLPITANYPQKIVFTKMSNNNQGAAPLLDFSGLLNVVLSNKEVEPYLYCGASNLQIPR